MRRALFDAWNRSGTPADEVLSFLSRIQEVLPYTPELHDAYQSKLKRLRFATPLLQAIARKEVLAYRLEHMRRQAEMLIERYGTNGPATERLESLREQYQSTMQEQDRVDRDIAAEAARYRREFGEDFVYKGKSVTGSPE